MAMDAGANTSAEPDVGRRVTKKFVGPQATNLFCGSEGPARHLTRTLFTQTTRATPAAVPKPAIDPGGPTTRLRAMRAPFRVLLLRGQP